MRLFDFGLKQVIIIGVGWNPMRNIPRPTQGSQEEVLSSNTSRDGEKHTTKTKSYHPNGNHLLPGR